MKIKTTKIIMLFFLLSMYINDSLAGEQALVGGMALDENKQLTKQYKLPSAWLLANSCAACHGTNGAEFNDIIPPLAGMNKEEFIQKMKKFKEQPPNDFVAMGIIAQPITDSEISAMAEFFSQQKPIEWTKPNWNKTSKKDK